MNRFFGTATVSTPHLTAEGWSTTMWKLESWIHLTWRKWINYAKYGKYCWALHFILNPGWQVLFATVCRIDDGWTCIYKQFWSVRVQVQKHDFLFSFVLRLEFRWTQPRGENMDMLPKAHHAFLPTGDDLILWVNFFASRRPDILIKCFTLTPIGAKQMVTLLQAQGRTEKT